MEVSEDIVIVGAGIAGLTTSLALNRLGIKSLVLESSDSLRSTGFAFSTWTNAWKALDAIGISDSLRRQHLQLSRITTISTISGLETSDMSLKLRGKKNRDHEVRCVKRKTLLETLSQQLPNSTIRYSSKVVSIEESGFFKVVHLADGTILKTKVLIGCDGVNSVVAKWLGFKKPILTGRYAIRGYAIFNDNHSFEPKFMQFFGGGNRYGVIPCDGNSVYWFFTWTPSSHEKEIGENPAKMKQYVLSKLGKAPHNIQAVIENTKLEDILTSPLVYRYPFELLWGNISKGSVCIAGDALHPMTPDVGQGGCSALEDGVVLARCLAEALLQEPNRGIEKDDNKQEKEEYKRIDMGLRRYAKERRMRSFELVSTAYLVGVMQQSNGKIMTLMRDKCLAAFLAGLLLKRAEYDCGRLKV